MFGLPIKLIIIVAAVMAGIAAIGGVYMAGHSAGTKGEALRTERAVAAERQRVDGVKDAQLAAARRQTEASEAENAASQQLADALEIELAKREAELAGQPPPAAGCACSSNPSISPTDAEKLNGIR